MSSAALQNLVYAIIQAIHNFGAAAVTGISGFGLMRRGNAAYPPRSILMALAIAWAVQGATGASFGVTTLAFDGKLPDIHGVAVYALFIKMTCVLLGLIVTAAAIKMRVDARYPFALAASASLAAIALGAAAFLRWFS